MHCKNEKRATGSWRSSRSPCNVLPLLPNCKTVLREQITGKALSLAPKKMVTATVLSALALLVISLGRINLAHLVLYPESPRFTTSHFLKQRHISKRTSLPCPAEQNLASFEPFCLRPSLNNEVPWNTPTENVGLSLHVLKVHAQVAHVVLPATSTMKPEQQS